jgi:hypothetical protein
VFIEHRASGSNDLMLFVIGAVALTLALGVDLCAALRTE